MLHASLLTIPLLNVKVQKINKKQQFFFTEYGIPGIIKTENNFYVPRFGVQNFYVPRLKILLKGDTIKTSNIESKF